MAVLTAEQRRRFEAEGYLVLRGVLDPERDLRPVYDEYSTALDRLARELHADGVIRDLHAGLPLEQRLIAICVESGRNFGQHFDFSLPQTGVTPDTPIHVGPAVFRLLSNPKLLDVAEDLIGPEIYSNPVQHIRMKLPARAVQAGSKSSLTTTVPWHQDNGVVMPEADEATILTVWLPLNRATLENGCMKVIPNSHGDGIVDHCPGLSSIVAIPEKLVPQGRELTLPMEPGDLLLMTQRTMHASLDNLTDDEVRISLDLRYQPVGQPTGRPAFAPAGFVARSRANPDSVLTDPAVWAANWLTLRDDLAARENPAFNRWRADAAVCA